MTAQAELERLTQQFYDDEIKLDALAADLADAKEKLAELERSYDGDIDKQAAQAVKLNLIVTQAEHKRRAIEGRRAALRAQIVAITNDAYIDHREAEKAAHVARVASADAALASDEVQHAIKTIRAAYALKGAYSYEHMIREITRPDPTMRESEALARELNLWVDDPDYPDHIAAAVNCCNIHDHELPGRTGLRTRSAA